MIWGEHRPEVSILINTYNYGRFVARAVESALQQDLPGSEKEIIIVDDGSTDETADVMQKFRGVVKYVQKQNGGQGSAINAGVSIAGGDIVCLLDADDFFYPTKLRTVLDAFHSDDRVGVVYNKFDVVDEAGRLLMQRLPHRLIAGDICARVQMGYICGSPTSGISGRRSLLLTLPIPEDRFRVSADFYYLALLPLITRVGVVESSQHAYRLHGSNAYAGKSGAAQLAIHSQQMESIWHHAESKLGKRFVQTVTVYDREALDASVPWARRLAGFGADLRTLLAIRGEAGLKSWTLAKITARLILGNRPYGFGRGLRDRVLPQQ